MARADGTDDEVGNAGGYGAGTYTGVYAGFSDARLTELLRADTATAYLGLQELRARHRPSVLTYARLCATSESTARQLAAQAFTLAARETARGTDPGVPWRQSSPPPKPTKSARPSPTHTTPPPPTPPPGSAYAQVVNLASGRCLDVDGDLKNGTDVVTAPCTASWTQRWRVDADRGVVQSSADSDFCLDSPG